MSSLIRFISLGSTSYWNLAGAASKSFREVSAPPQLTTCMVGAKEEKKMTWKKEEKRRKKRVKETMEIRTGVY